MPAQPKAAVAPVPGPERDNDPVSAKVLRKREVLARVAHAADVPQNQVRAVVDITLAELGRAIAAGETLALPPFGRARVSRQSLVKGGEVLVIRLRRKAGDENAWAWADDPHP